MTKNLFGVNNKKRLYLQKKNKINSPHKKKFFMTKISPLNPLKNFKEFNIPNLKIYIYNLFFSSSLFSKKSQEINDNLFLQQKKKHEKDVIYSDKNIDNFFYIKNLNNYIKCDNNRDKSNLYINDDKFFLNKSKNYIVDEFIDKISKFYIKIIKSLNDINNDDSINNNYDNGIYFEIKDYIHNILIISSKLDMGYQNFDKAFFYKENKRFFDYDNFYNKDYQNHKKFFNLKNDLIKIFNNKNDDNNNDDNNDKNDDSDDDDDDNDDKISNNNINNLPFKKGKINNKSELSFFEYKIEKLSWYLRIFIVSSFFLNRFFNNLKNNKELKNNKILFLIKNLKLKNIFFVFFTISMKILEDSNIPSDWCSKIGKLDKKTYSEIEVEILSVLEFRLGITTFELWDFIFNILGCK